MAIKHNGKSPGPAWYTRQRARALIATLSDKDTAREARATLRNAALSAASVTGGIATFSYITFLGVPSLLLVTGLAAGGWFGLQTRRGIKSLRISGPFSRFIRAQEERWAEKKSRPPLTARIKTFCQKTITAPFRRSAAPPEKGTAKNAAAPSTKPKTR